MQKLYSVFTTDKLKSGDIQIIQLKEVHALNKRELQKIENDFICDEIGNPLCLNTIRAYIDEQQKKEIVCQRANIYYGEHRVEVKERIMNMYKNDEETRQRVIKKASDFYKKNRDAILMHIQEKVNCECGASVNRGHLKRHKTSLKHKNFINTQNKENIN